MKMLGFLGEMIELLQLQQPQDENEEQDEQQQRKRQQQQPKWRGTPKYRQYCMNILLLLVICDIIQNWDLYLSLVIPGTKSATTMMSTTNNAKTYLTKRNETIATTKKIDANKKNRTIEKIQLEFVHITKTGGSNIEHNGLKANITWGFCHWSYHSEMAPLACINGKYRTYDDRESDSQKYFKIYQPSNPEYQYRTQMNHTIETSFELWHAPPSWLDPRYSPYADQEEIINRKNKTNKDEYDENNDDINADEIIIIKKRLFTVVRNPYTRMISEFYCPYFGYDPIAFRDPDFLNPYTNETNREQSIRLNNNQGIFNYKKVRVTKKIFNSWILMALRTKPILSTGHCLPQYEYVYDTSSFVSTTNNNNDTDRTPSSPPFRQVIHHVLRYENLTDEFNELMIQFNITNVSLSDAAKVNQNNKHSNQYTVHDLYDATIHKINEFFYYDFIFFNYTMIQPPKG